MDEIEIRKQRQMTLGETFEFCLSSIRHRFGRSILTLCVVILAVAFFMFLQCSNIFRNSVRAGVEREIIENRKPSKLLGMLYSPCTQIDYIRLVVDSRRSPEDAARIRQVSKIDDARMRKLSDGAYNELRYLNFFDELTIGKRKELFGHREGSERLEYFIDAKGALDKQKFQDTMKKMRELGGIRLPDGEGKFSAFLDSYHEYRILLKNSYANWLALQKSMVDKDVPQNDAARIRQFIIRIAEQPEALAAWRSKLAAQGFVLSDAELDSIIHYQKMTEQIEKVKALLYTDVYRKKWRRVYGQNMYSRMDEKLEHLDDKKTLALLKDAEFGGIKVTDEDMKGIAHEFRARKELRELEQLLDINLLKDSGGFSASQIYLMCLSFLVCVVGITNAMLMSITERFREIATLKCLGATDSFILIQIVLEAMIQGVIGGVIGLTLGFLVAMTNSLFQIGTRIFSTFDWSMIGYSALFSLLAGVLLSVLSSLYPSSKAARMAPMEAMRVE